MLLVSLARMLSILFKSTLMTVAMNNPAATTLLTTTNHSRDSVGLQYVYPVISRRAGGLSVGINVNTNNACNWRCLYCQVPNLSLGGAPTINLPLLEKELRKFLVDVQQGDFYQRFGVPVNQQRIKDIAISGNGEPTSLRQFDETVDLIGRIVQDMAIVPDSKFVLITNGSLIHLPKVQQGLRTLKNYGGEVWFKLDSSTQAGRQLINNAAQPLATHLENLVLAANLCTAKLQICLFTYNNDLTFAANEQQALLKTLQDIKNNTSIDTVMLYTLARPSLQPEAPLLEKLTPAALDIYAETIRALGFYVTVSY
jgi:wyosine [tRNA(Phe)-imidazoG37] synthetase (radical SAM superfamily)